MTLAKLKLVAGVVLACGAVTAGGVWAGGQKPPAATPGERAAVEGPKRTADAAQWRRSRSNTRQLAEAAKAHLDGYRYMVCNYSADDGTPLLSWRVRLLSFLGYDELFRRFNKREPWDGPTNRPLLAEMPPVYRTGFQPATATDTYYQAVAGPNSLFDPAAKKLGLGLLDLVRKADTTVVCVEAGPPVAWTKPADLPYRADGPLPDARAPFAEVIHVVMADGQAYPVRRDKADATVWRGWLDRLESAKPTWRQELRADPPPADPAADRAEATRLRADTLALLARLEARIKQPAPLPSPQDVDRLDETNFALRRLVDEWPVEQPAAK